MIRAAPVAAAVALALLPSCKAWRDYEQARILRAQANAAETRNEMIEEARRKNGGQDPIDPAVLARDFRKLANQLRAGEVEDVIGQLERASDHFARKAPPIGAR